MRRASYSAANLVILSLLFLGACQGNAQKTRILQGHTAAIFSLAFTPDGSRLASASKDQTLRVWDLQTGKEIAKFTEDSWVSCVSISPDGKKLLSSAGQRAIVRDLESGKELFQAIPRDNIVPTSAMSPVGTIAAIEDYDAGAFVRLWDLATSKEIRTFGRGGRGYYEEFAFSADGQRLAGLMGTPDSQTIPSFLIVWDVLTGTEIRRVELLDRPPRGMDLSPDGRRLLGAFSNGLALWDVETGKELRRLDIWVWGGMYCVKFSPDGKSFLANGPASPAILRDVETFEHIQTLSGNGGMAFSPKGDQIAVGDNGPFWNTIRVWAIKRK